MRSPQQQPMRVNVYYSDALTTDTEGNLVQLCDDCAAAHADQVRFASRGDIESVCEYCDTANLRTSFALPAADRRGW